MPPSTDIQHSLHSPHQISERHVEIAQCLKTTSLIHVDDSYIPDEVINAALKLMKGHLNGRVIVGQLTPAEMELALVSNMPLMIIHHRKLCVNIHHINDHWVTSSYDPTEKNVTVYDSLISRDRIRHLQKQLHILYGYISKTHNVPIKQQGNNMWFICNCCNIPSFFRHCA